MQNSDNRYTAYLFVYFTGNFKYEEAIHFAISEDGYRFKALNGNKPVISSEKISSSGSIRDPHILRGSDESFYMVATDMVSALGWESNRAMVLMRSTDLINWNSAVVNIQDRFPGNDSLQRVWAPQTIYDREKNKYMIYWSMKFGEDPDKIYYAYANADFTDLDTVPKQLFYNPNNNASIDGDIVCKDGHFFLFFKTHEDVTSLNLAISDCLTGEYILQEKELQQTEHPAEGSCVYKLNNGKGYMLIYDLYMHGKYQFTKTTDFESFEIVDDEVSMDFQPRHGTVMPITSLEAARLKAHWH